ncbi:Dual-specificity tyrosine-phosphorylation regulated kinase [Olea europaea subsp. europaea]|uniref:Dual-specificity tyrosine-phosphorylation regulated kinase n=1 Tax=Olea europaea subsp. europaea TaxID=158383 RepID=A0A8S0S358_OLEEU|nr:Dual-specificity tyrosine-phosphorylation regulated kinase [Olea europaea subsp. europaea]
MAESSVDSILEFLRRNKFKKAEAALCNELYDRPDLNGFPQKLTLEYKASGSKLREEANGKNVIEEDGRMTFLPTSGEGAKEPTSSPSSGEVSKELIVEEIQCGTGRNGSESNWKSNSYQQDQSKVNESIKTRDKNVTFSKSSDDTMLDLYSWKYNPGNGLVPSYQNDGENNFSGFRVHGKSMLNSTEILDSSKANAKSGEDVSKPKWSDKSQLKEVDQQQKLSGMCSNDSLVDNPWSISDESSHQPSELRRNCLVKMVFPFSKGDTSACYDSASVIGGKEEGKRKTELGDIRTVIKDQVDEVGRALYFGKTHGGDPKDFSALDFPLTSENQKEELPRLPPVRLKSEDKSFSIHCDEKFEDEPGPNIMSADNVIGSFLDVPIGQEVGKKTGGGNWLSVSQGIVAEDASDLVSGFATIGDGLSESVDYPNEYWDSDEYDDDDDVGYMRQPIEDEAWFLAHEIDYPSDNEKGTGHGSVPDPHEQGQNKDDEDDQSFAEEDSYLSGEQYIQSKNLSPIIPSGDPTGLSVTENYRRNDENDLITQYDGQLMDEEELNFMRAEPVWQGFVTQSNELIMLGDGKALNECGRPHLDDICVDDDQHGSVRSIGVGINSNAADMGSEVKETLVGGSSEGNFEYSHDHHINTGRSKHSQHDPDNNIGERKGKNRISTHNFSENTKSDDRCAFPQAKNHVDGSFSFPPPRGGQLVSTGSNISLWSSKDNNAVSDKADDNTVCSNDVLASRRQKSTNSSPAKSSRDENTATAVGSVNSSPSSLSNYGYIEREHVKREEDAKTSNVREDDPGASLEDEEAAAVQEQVKQIKAQEEEFETFNLKIVHRKNRTGFEEDKSFHVVLNSVIAGRYHVTEYLGSAAFSKAIQAHDLHMGMDVCVKIIKNNKDFFDQSLDEIKLLKYVNKHDPADKYHILRLYDYFYYREHLLIVCELLKANLYEFHKFNRESGGEVYFTMPRLQSITIQCLEALQFLHGLGLIHCDLKPENILVKSYSRCEVKVIDLGSSCFETDHLCSYVQSRSYRAPEVILGLPYDKKIDIWSLGCILAELCTGNVLFQNDSSATLLARVIGIIGPIDQEMLVRGRDTYKYFTKNHMLYERNQETNRLEYLIPKKSSLRHRLPMGDQGFIDFVAHLLEINPKKRPSASEALKHPWLQYPYEPISS